MRFVKEMFVGGKKEQVKFKAVDQQGITGDSIES